LNINGSVPNSAAITATGTVNFNGNTSTTATGSRTVGAVTINPGGLVTIQSSTTAAQPMVLTTASVTFGDSTAKLDLTNNTLVTTSTLASIRSAIFKGSLKTSTAGLAVGSISLISGQIEARATLLGDSDLDGKVNIADLANLAGNFGKTTSMLWINGDFDYNGNVNIADLADLAGNFGKSLISAGFANDSAATPAAAAAATSVPEPAGLAVLGLAAAAGALMRRSRQT
jgi:hypothetical protein